MDIDFGTVLMIWGSVFILIMIFRPEWLLVRGADPLSQWLRQRRRKKYGDKYK